ncbi:hypothetical protein AB833_11835 [Chromatiales bacterium (ex Bugula neritina AB1)]|nr:hypothetical protein AB833_11835 [Chromatiales bacterium (ex Bugula neritina AB1)]
MSRVQPARIDLNPLGGIAGDMFAAALFDAFPDQFAHFQNDLEQLGIDGLGAERQVRQSKGMRAGYFRVIQNTGLEPPRTLSEVENFLRSKALDSEVLGTASGIYRLLAQAEAAVHGKTLHTIHFHEVSDWDSMVDILAAAGIIARLGCCHWRIGPLPLGGGTVNTEHGAIMMPAPATTELLHGYQWIDDGIAGERVTPTGAAIVAYLKPLPLQTGGAPMQLLVSGTGCGSRELADRANILRATAYGHPDGASRTLQQDQVLQLAFEIDDMTGEELASAMDRVRAHCAVLDVSSLTMAGKKNRTATGIRVLAQPGSLHELIELCFAETSTLGVRYTLLDRYIVQRSQHEIDGLRVKVAQRPDGTLTAKIESDQLSENSLAARRRLAMGTEAKLLKQQGRQRDD